MKIAVATSFLLCCEMALCATWYVRPPGSTYGAGNGTTYSNAWAGLSSVSGTATGDTLYICGMHLDGTQNHTFPSGTTFRGDYPSDPGTWVSGFFWTAAGSSNMTFYAINFRTNWDVLNFVTPTTYVTFDSCTNLYGVHRDLYYGNDHWTFTNCEFGFTQNGVYTHFSGGNAGPDYLTVSHCYFHDIATTDYPDNDGHGVGVQGSSLCLIERNSFNNTGAAIEFWTSGSPYTMTNNVIRYNFIQNTAAKAVTDGGGINVSGNSGVEPGMRTGFQIYGNIIRHTGTNRVQSWQGHGIGSNSEDPIAVYNNVIYEPSGDGIHFVPLNATCTGSISNNIVINTTNYYIYLGGTNCTAGIDYGLYSPVANTSGGQFYRSSGSGFGSHNVFSAPQFASGSPSSAVDFKLSAGSPAIHAGTEVGIAADFAGVAFANPPSIGAFEFSQITNAIGKATSLHVQNLYTQ